MLVQENCDLKQHSDLQEEPAPSLPEPVQVQMSDPVTSTIPVEEPEEDLNSDQQNPAGLD